MIKTRVFRQVLFCLILISFLAVPAHARWSDDGEAIGPFIRPVPELAKVASDGAGGAIIAWKDSRSGSWDLYARRVDSSGNNLWAADGMPVYTGTADVGSLFIVSDASGGAIIVWTDNRLGNTDIYTQRLDPDGAPQWTLNGVAICTYAEYQLLYALVPDGYGGAIVTWADGRSGTDYDIYAQRINEYGSYLWAAGGYAVCTAPEDQHTPDVVCDGYGGAIVTWRDYRSGSNWDIYAQRISSGGATWWTSTICNESSTQYAPAVTTDGAGGAIVTWHDKRSDDGDIYAQRVNGIGAQLWASQGAIVCGAASYQVVPDIVYDGAGGAIITWEDYSTGSWNISAQRISSVAVRLWGTNGMAVTSLTGTQTGNPHAESDGAGGIIITWQDDRDNSTYYYNLYTQRISNSGIPQWTTDGVPICTLPGAEPVPGVCSDGAGGVLIAFEKNEDVRVQKVHESGTLLWDTDGTIACFGRPDQHSHEVVSGDFGGAVIAWIDEREEKNSIYSQRMSYEGIALWDAEGEPVCTLPGDRDGLGIIADGASGCIMAWRDTRNGNWDVFVQRVNVWGNSLWLAGGLAVCSVPTDEADPCIASDGSGGAIVAWSDNRGSNHDVYAQRVDSNGNLLWTTNGVAVCTATGDQDSLCIVPDGTGGAVISWIDTRNSNNDIYAQRINASGAVQWTDGGVAICTDASTQMEMQLVRGGSGGAIVLWIDDRSGLQVFGQRVDSGGTVEWTADGLLLVDTLNDIYELSAATDGAGGAFFCWTKDYVTNTRVIAQRVFYDGDLLYGSNGLQLGSYSGDTEHFNPHVAPDGSGGALFAWCDMLDDYYTYIHIHRIEATGHKLWDYYGVKLSSDYSVTREPRIVSNGAHGAIAVWQEIKTGKIDLFANGVTGSICEIEPVEIDFGYVELFEYSDTVFTIRNLGDVTLNADVTESCDHFSIENGEGWNYIAAGDSAEITVRFTSDYPDTHTCEISTNAPSCGNVALTANGLGPVCDIDPLTIYIQDLVIAGSYTDTSFTITNTGGGLLLGDISESSDHYSILEGGGLFGLYTGDSLLVVVRFEPTYKGTHECIVETGAFSCSEISITGEAFECPPGNVLYVDAGAMGADDGTSWADAFNKLYDALDRSDLCENVTEIWVAGGTYKPADRYSTFQLRDSLALYGGFAGNETLLGERDLSVNHSILSGGIGAIPLSNVLRVVTGSGTNSTAVIDGFTITEGNANHRNYSTGAGMYNDGGKPMVRNIIFRNNHANTYGGGMCNENGSEPALYNVVFYENSSGNLGGGMYNDSSSPAVVNVTFSCNWADDEGAGMFNENGSNPLLINVIMWNDSTTSMILPEIANHNSSDPAISYSLIQDCGESGPGWESAFGVDGGHNIDRDPDFVDMPSGDLHLLEGSHAVDSGEGTVPGLPATDLDGNPRIQGSGIDMGAYEGEFYTVEIRVDTDPSHLDVTVDGDTVMTRFDFYTRSGVIHELGALTPQVQGDIIYSFTGWSDAGDTIHDITVPEDEVVTYTASFFWSYAYADIDSIVDVPDDQGGWVRLYFRRSYYDNLTEEVSPIERYDMHRRVDDLMLATVVLGEGTRTKEGYIEYDGRRFLSVEQQISAAAAGGDMPAAAPPGLWEVVGTVSAAQQEQYIGLVPTVADSSATIHYSVYYISAHSTTPAVFFDSPADSGYSVDDIAPGVPLGMAVAYNTGSGNQLTWDASPEPDFQYYRIYRGDEEGFVPGPGNLVHQTADPDWTDPEYDGWDVHYKITALDYVGNESDAASPTSTTGDDVPSVVNAFVLYQNAPNPFNPVTMIRFDLPRAEHVRLCVYNVKGELVSTIVDQRMPEGRKDVVWSAKDNRGQAVSSGIYFYRLIAGDFVQTKKMVLLQ